MPNAGPVAAGEAAVADVLARLVRNVPDFPREGVLFKDIAPLLGDPDGFRIVIDALAEGGRNSAGQVVVDKVAGIEARGFLLAAPVAVALGVGLVPVRKLGKLPGLTLQASYELEYGEATLEVQSDAFGTGERVLVVDDVLATGGTVEAALTLVERAGAVVTAVAVLIELTFLGARERLGSRDVRALLRVDA
ncbi:MAG: adenine phosphoribosyltransferase [Nocardioidaceae bacterium]